MLKEYMKELQESNQRELEDYEAELKNLKRDLKCAQDWMAKLQKEQNLDRFIFSPRTRENSNMEKLEAARKEQEEIQEKIQCVCEKINDVLAKKQECEKLQEEVETNVSRETSSDTVVIQKENRTDDCTAMTENIEDGSEIFVDKISAETEESSEPEPQSVLKKMAMDPEKVSGKIAAAIEMAVKRNESGKYTEKSQETETQSEEPQNEPIEAVQVNENEALQEKDLHKEESERRKEFLTSIYKKTELCMALLNGDKNKCRNEMRELKRMIKKYAEETENN